MLKKKEISIFFPCFNDSKTIGILVKNAFDVLSERAEKFEVIVVDDGSEDLSRTILKKLAKKYKDLRLVFHDKNRGYGAALRSGFKKAKYELIFYTDGDGQYDVLELPHLLILMTPEIDFVNGIKKYRNDPTYRIVVGNLYNFVCRWFFWLPIQDVDCDFRLVRKEIVDQLDLQSTSGSICIELVKKAERAGAKFMEASVNHYERRFGQSQFFQPKRIIETLTDGVKLWFGLMLFDKLLLRRRPKVSS